MSTITILAIDTRERALPSSFSLRQRASARRPCVCCAWVWVGSGQHKKRTSEFGKAFECPRRLALAIRPSIQVGVRLSGHDASHVECSAGKETNMSRTGVIGTYGANFVVIGSVLGVLDHATKTNPSSVVDQGHV